MGEALDLDFSVLAIWGKGFTFWILAFLTLVLSLLELLPNGAEDSISE